jgi:protein phosphatase
VIGDVHGCYEELTALLTRLRYAPDRSGTYRHPAGRRAIFLGDLVDRGPRIPDVLRLAMNMAAAGAALGVIGNHDDKLLRKLKGRHVHVAHGLAESLTQLAAQPAAFQDDALRFLDGLPDHCLLDGGNLVVAHAGMPNSSTSPVVMP